VAAFFVLKDGLQDVPKKSLKKAHCIFSGFMINKIPTFYIILDWGNDGGRT